MLFIIVALLSVCAVVVWGAKRRNGHDPALGWMSERWLAEQRASRR